MFGSFKAYKNKLIPLLRFHVQKISDHAMQIKISPLKIRLHMRGIRQKTPTTIDENGSLGDSKPEAVFLAMCDPSMNKL